jgi:pyruvate dehydrogenase E2 component (dihydrolipoamide acetyltransferase)
VKETKETKEAGEPAPAKEAKAPGPEPERPRLSPRARRLAAQGAGGPSTMREAIGAAMAKSKREIPHYYLQSTIDLTAALAWLEGENQKRPVEQRVLPAALLLKATALSLVDVPELNGTFTDGAFRPAPGVHLGVAINLKGGGLVVPAIHDVARLALPELMRGLLDLVERARGGGLRSSEMSDSTVTVTNLGDLGVESVWGVIFPPQVAIVGFGRVVERPWVRDGRVEVARVVSATLAADHRVTDGHRGGQFLQALERHLKEPATL